MVALTERTSEIDEFDGQPDAGEAEDIVGSDERNGLSRHIDVQTALLGKYERTWHDFQTMRKALAQREVDEDIIEDFARIEKRLSARLTKTLRKHPLWPWLQQYPGLGGAHVARVIATIGDPRRFPGQRCTVGHYHPPLYEVGTQCPNVVLDSGINQADGGGADFANDGCVESAQGHVRENGAAADARYENDRLLGRCPGTMLPPRDTTGVRSVWHYLGLHVDENGQAPRKRKGVQCSWHPLARASLLMPDSGIAAQIVRLRVPKYRDIYDQAKERLARERGIVTFIESEMRRGADTLVVIETTGGTNGAQAEGSLASENRADLRPFQIEQRARIIAVKAFVGDLLVEWKRLAAASLEIDRIDG